MEHRLFRDLIAHQDDDINTTVVVDKNVIKSKMGGLIVNIVNNGHEAGYIGADSVVFDNNYTEIKSAHNGKPIMALNTNEIQYVDILEDMINLNLVHHEI